MAKNNDTDHNGDKTDNGQSNGKSSHLQWVFIGGGIAMTGLLWASVWWPNLTERIKFFTGNLLNLVIGLAVIAQVLIYRKQRDIMQNQWTAMHDQLEVMRDNLSRNEQTSEKEWFIAREQLNLAGEQWKTMGEQTFISRGQMDIAIETAKITERQLEAMQGQLAAMERQTEYAQRAYLSVPIANLSAGREITGGNEFFLFMLRVKNSGNTPAYNVEVVMSRGIAVDPPDPALPSDTDVRVNAGMVGPNAEIKTWIRAPEPQNEQIQLWMDNKLQVYCSGIITYRTFGKTRTTKFCILRRPGSMEMEPYGKWNDGD